ncbi:MAG: hypothetical protein J3R72DRAFT_453556 [Linnemannia gamsii]|nr:MAG: hypothetical protein J3R72DRAFT_453556 [Linnemannia gamsii]
MQLSFTVASCLTACACVSVAAAPSASVAAPKNATIDTTFVWVLSCSDDPLGDACYHACSCSRIGGKLLCPKYLPDGAPTTPCSRSEKPPRADCVCENTAQCGPPQNLC